MDEKIREGVQQILAAALEAKVGEYARLPGCGQVERFALKRPPKLAVGDGALGFGAAVERAWPSCRQQRYWVHKTVNVLDKLPQKLQPEAKERLHDIWMAATKKDAQKAFDRFSALYGAKYEKACACLMKDRDELLSFYDFPAEHWCHLRTTNVIESSFATTCPPPGRRVRHRTRQTKGAGSRDAALALMFRLGRECEKGWRQLNGHQKLARPIVGVRFIDGVEEKAKAA